MISVHAVRVWKWLLYSILIALVVYAVNSNIPFAGKKILTYTFEKPHNSISHPRPWVRYQELEEYNDRKKVIKIIEDPIYFDVWTPVAYRKVRLELMVKNVSKTTLSIGLRRSSSQWDIVLQPLTILREEGDWTVGYGEFDLSDVPLQYQKYTFLISAPGLVLEKPENGYVLLARERIILERESLIESIWNRIVHLKKMKSI